MLLNAQQSSLLVVDVQEKLAPAVENTRATIDRIAVLMKAAAKLDVPITITEHYPKGIGHTVPDLAALAPAEAVCEKITFACQGSEAAAARLGGLGRPQVVVAGMETHVCVLQSALSLLADGYAVFLARDAVSSRRAEDRDTAIERLQRSGGTIVTTEMVLFEWLERGDTPAFRELLTLIK